MLTWYCPEGGLEHRMLHAVGWKVEHYITVDGIQWCKLVKAADEGDIRCLN